jgi:hypothetical protein
MSDSKEVPKNVDGASCPSRCYAMIVYQPPSIFNAQEQAMTNHGTYAEASEAIRSAALRQLGVPRWMFDQFFNYSSSKLDARVQTRKAAKSGGSFA